MDRIPSPRPHGPSSFGEPAASPDSPHDPVDPRRRGLLQGGLGLIGLAAALSGCAAAGGHKSASATKLGFTAVPPSRADTVVVPEGYVAEVIAPWGEPLGIAGAASPAWRPDAGNTAEEQALQMGMHHDGMQFYPLPAAPGTQRGLLTMNHEYTDDGLLHPRGLADGWSAEKVCKGQAAHGISVIEIERREAQGGWRMVRPSPFARRITATTPCRVGGPAAGHPLMQTAADPSGRTVLGTLANCAAGRTPWGTYLSGEENFNSYFDGGPQPDPHARRYAIRDTAWMRWSLHDERFDARRHPNEFNRFGWVVEVDPHDPASPPVKRTALGRAAHEGAWVATTRDGRAVVYSGEDARFQFIYKFVSRDTVQPGGAKANATLLDHGTLYAARFDADGRGRWLPLVHGQGPLTAEQGFADQGEVVVKARQACDAVGATPMDRPEWLAIDPQAREVFCSLTNNIERGLPGRPGVDAANPRERNTMGQVIRWTEDEDFDATTFRWRHLMLAGDPANPREAARGDVRGDAFACPDGLVLDGRGVLWVQTDASSSELHRGEFERLGNNQMLACDPATGEVRRFLTGPVNCEITGATFTPDGCTMFVNIQHPGEPPSDRSDPGQVDRYSSWPDATGRPRSATVVVRRRDGGVIGA